ncbi:MAG: hypothetical protein EOO10_03105 [Chitinophagaceae bacterium]|nr:MAG: hypothetical protein EOO10_03105 [Chitinophagaceae bacterium]
MRSAIYLLIAALIFSSCANQKAEDAPPVVKGKTLVTLPISPDKVKGTYIGDFKGSPIAITLNYVSDNHASGYNVHKGLTRNISGTIEATATGLHLELSEPGNNQYDGKFDFVIDTTNWTAKGNWAPFKKGEEANFQLKKKVVLKEEDQWEMIFTDTLQNYITLQPDGACTYTYLTDTTNTGQEHTIRGNYTQEKKTVTVYWEKNNVFPQKSVFTLIETKPYKDEDYVEKTLKGEGKVFSQLWD